MIATWQIAVTFTVVIVILSVIILEAIYTFHCEKTRKKEIYYEHDVLSGDRSGITYRMTPHSSYWLKNANSGPFLALFRRYNNLGVARETDTQMRPQQGNYRALLYGDSVSHGFPISHEETFSYLLEVLINKTIGLERVEILNMVRGNSPVQYAFHIREDIRSLSPHLIIMQIELLGDIADELSFRILKSDSDGLPTKTNGGRYKRHLYSKSIMLRNLGFRGFWFERTILYTKISRFIGRLLNKIIVPAPDHYNPEKEFFYDLGFDRFMYSRRRINKTKKRMFEIIAGIQKYCNGKGVDFILLITPSSHLLVSEGTAPVLEINYRNNYLSLFSEAQKYCSEMGINYIAFNEQFLQYQGRNIALFSDVYHPTPLGHQIIAATLFPVLMAKVSKHLRPFGTGIG